ncbi:hypothetical protein NEMIN01_0419 [Nematocida minor]|uniref:uncharacterized protein n=1 Tax=Nematocida minor TaxID=1912983 RepID=UPI00221EC78A|nr:uncharacterized protein NEMIN01_0419 [Nematocida minor]KAI5189356.1 hypothetical protein NEMIN01_0419 [Nematocida minor]
MIVTCRQCRRSIGNNKWEIHSKCTNLLSDERIAGTKMEEQQEGRIHCEHCNKVLGRFKWHGAKCMCGRWVFPYISIHKSNTDIVG